METEVEASKRTFEIQKARISSQSQELAEQRLLVEKQAGELREQQLMMSEQRKLFQEQSEYTRKMMADFNSLKEEMNHLKSNDAGDNVRREAPLTEGRMPVPEEAPNFSSFPVGESSTTKEYKPSDEQESMPHPNDPLQHDDPWKKYHPSSGPTGIPTSFGDNLFGEPKQNTTFPDPGAPHANASGGSAATGNSAESLLRELISALGNNSSNRVQQGSKVKEAETLRFPEFPTPEKYRSWRTAVREEIRAASDRPDDAWTWLLKVYDEREDKKNHMAELCNPAEFVTLDTKILAQLSKVARGELARQILTFKDVEAQNKRVVRGRQVLLMFEQYFKTNEEAGALYGTEDLLQVRLQSDDLKSFLQNWDAVIAGMKRIPDENTLKDLFLRQLRKSRRMGYDLDVYDRSSDGSHHRSYAYLVQAVRDLLARERLKLNRDRISKSNDMRYSTAASGEHSDSSIRRSPSPRRSPGSSNRGSGICFEYAKKGSCKHGNKCKYKHEKPRERSHSSRTRSSLHSSRSRRSSSGSANRTDKSQVPCRYFKKGHCRRGDSCPFKHESTSSSAAAPTRERAGSPSAKPKGDRRERSGRSQGRRRSSGGDRRSGRNRRDGKPRRSSPRSKSAENSTSAPCINYACVVIKGDYWEISESGNVVTRHHLNDRDVLFDRRGTKCPFPVRMLSDTRRTRYDQEDYENSCIKDNWRLHDSDKSIDSWTGKTIFRLKNKHQVAMSSQRKKVFKVSFGSKVKTRTFQVEGDMFRHQRIKQSKQKLYPTADDCPKPKEADTLEAIRCAKSLSETLQASNISPKCDFECDHQPLCPSDLCCRCCRVIPKEEMPKYARVSSTPARSKGTRWLGDTGTDQDIVGESHQVVAKSNIREADVNITLSTANGPITADKSIDTHIPALCEGFSPYVLKDSPPALSIGQRCLEDGYDFVWGRNNKPIFVRPDSEVVEFKMSSRVPFLDDECYPITVPDKLVSALRRSIDNIHEYVSQHSFSTPAEKAVDDIIDAEVEEQLRNPPEPEYAGEEGGTEEGSEEEEPTDDEEIRTEDEGVDEIDINPPTDDEQDRVYGNKTEEELRKDAISPEHLFTHRPKNPYCETCKRAKMMRPYATRKGGSRHVRSNKFGDHIVADHVIMKKSVDTGVQDEHVMMVVKDVYTQYRYAYPSDSKSTDEIIKGFNHFLKSTDKVGVVYTDNSPEFCAAIKEYGVVHQTSVEYLDSTKSVVEREARTMLEGARSNLVQANIDISMWPYAVRHHCMAMNLSEQLSGDRSPWDLRNKRDFTGKIIPFGCLVYFWEDRKRPDSIAGKMSPSSSQGVFLGYHIQAGHVWRDEYLVAHLDGLDYRLADGSVKVIRTKRLEIPDGDFVFPLRKDQQISVMDVDCDFEPSSDEGGPDDDDDPDGNDGRGDGKMAKEPPPRDQPAEEHPTSVEVEPPTDKGSVDDVLEVLEDLGEGHEPSSSSSKPPRKEDKKKDYSWFDLFYDDTVDPYKMPDGKPVPKGYVYDGARLVRYRKGSKRVPGYPSDLWGRLSRKERNRRWEEYQKSLEDKDKNKDKDDSKSTCAPQANALGGSSERFAVPSMPIEHCDYEPHRSNMCALVEDKLSEIQKKLDFDLFANVAKVLTKHEISKSPGAQKALDAEWEKLLNKKTWDQSRVKECRSIVEDAKRKGEKVHIGRIFEICTLKGSELPEGDPNRKHKGRTCFQGNNVFDESSDYAIFAEMSSSPASWRQRRSSTLMGHNLATRKSRPMPDRLTPRQYLLVFQLGFVYLEIGGQRTGKDYIKTHSFQCY